MCLGWLGRHFPVIEGFTNEDWGRDDGSRNAHGPRRLTRPLRENWPLRPSHPPQLTL